MKITPVRVEFSGMPGQSVKYTLHISNTGSLKKTFNISTSGQWIVPPSLTNITLEAGTGMDITIYMNIPTNATNGTQDVSAVTVMSGQNPAVKDTATLTTHVAYFRIFLPIVCKIIR